MFSYFFDSSNGQAQGDQPPATAGPPPSSLMPTTLPMVGSKNQPQSDEQYKIDPGYYFKHLDPPQIQNMLTNFTTELDTGAKKFNDTLLVKYENVLGCQGQFQQMSDRFAELMDNLREVESNNQDGAIGSIGQVMTDVMHKMSRADDDLNTICQSTESYDTNTLLKLLKSSEPSLVESVEQRQFLENQLLHKGVLDPLHEFISSEFPRHPVHVSFLSMNLKVDSPADTLKMELTPLSKLLLNLCACLRYFCGREGDEKGRSKGGSRKLFTNLRQLFKQNLCPARREFCRNDELPDKVRFSLQAIVYNMVLEGMLSKYDSSSETPEQDSTDSSQMTITIKIIELARELDSFFAHNQEAFDAEVTRICQQELIEQLKMNLQSSAQSQGGVDQIQHYQLNYEGTIIRNLQANTESILRLQSRHEACPYTPLLTHYLVSLFQKHFVLQIEFLVCRVIPDAIAFQVGRASSGFQAQGCDGPNPGLINDVREDIYQQVFNISHRLGASNETTDGTPGVNPAMLPQLQSQLQRLINVDIYRNLCFQIGQNLLLGKVGEQEGLGQQVVAMVSQNFAQMIERVWKAVMTSESHDTYTRLMQFIAVARVESTLPKLLGKRESRTSDQSSEFVALLKPQLQTVVRTNQIQSIKLLYEYFVKNLVLPLTQRFGLSDSSFKQFLTANVRLIFIETMAEYIDQLIKDSCSPKFSTDLLAFQLKQFCTNIKRQDYSEYRQKLNKGQAEEEDASKPDGGIRHENNLLETEDEEETKKKALVAQYLV